MSSHVLVAAAVSGEVSALMQCIESPTISNVGGRKITSGYLEGKPVKILITDPGVVNTVQALTASIENSRPSLIIQTGCAGAFKEAGIEVGDIGIATEEIDAQLGIESIAGGWPLDGLPFPLIRTRNLDLTNRYPLDQAVASVAYDILTAHFGTKGNGITKGRFLTVSTVTATDKRARDLYEAFGACMEQMEGAGAAHLALHYRLPFLEIRAASNIVGKRDLKAWDLPLSFARSASAVRAFLRAFDPQQIQIRR